jgi:hypothetical protein
VHFHLKEENLVDGFYGKDLARVREISDAEGFVGTDP